MSNITGHAILKIVKGVQKVPGDTLSSEVGLDEIDLLDANGFACDEYDMKLPALKSSAVWVDSPLTDGRTLISGALGNVTETIRLQLSAGTIIQMAAMLSKLGRFKQDCNDFWDTFNQIEPVYIKHQVVGEPGPRYALLYDIDIDPGQQPLIPSEAKRTVTLVIEREYGWRGLAPGDNPKKWAIENVFINQKFTAAKASLALGNDFLFIDTAVENRAERLTASTYRSKNFVDIPAASIPGDLPALMLVSLVSANSGSTTSVMMAKTTKRNNYISRNNGSNQPIIHVYNAVDAIVGTDTTLAADTGACIGISGLQRRSQTTFVTNTLIKRLQFSSVELSVQRGKYAAFLRARLSAANNVATLQLVVNELGDDVTTLPQVSFSSEGSPSGTGNTTSWGLAYLGQVTVPSNDRKIGVNINGMGIGIDVASNANLIFNLYASRPTGAGSLYVNDLILIPIDEGAVNIIARTNDMIGDTSPLIYDNTGYMQHGGINDYASSWISSPLEQDLLQLVGNSIYLSPGIDNRLEFLTSVDATKLSAINDNPQTTVRVSIVPRWSGLRDR